MEGLQITPAGYQDAMNLQRAIANAIKGSDIELPKSIKDDINLSGFMDAALSVISSTEVENALFKCSERAVFNGSKVTREFFDNPENRAFFFEIMLEIIKENVGPFFKGIVSRFPVLGAIQKSIPK